MFQIDPFFSEKNMRYYLYIFLYIFLLLNGVHRAFLLFRSPLRSRSASATVGNEGGPAPR